MFSPRHLPAAPFLRETPQLVNNENLAFKGPVFDDDRSKLYEGKECNPLAASDQSILTLTGRCK